MLSTVFGFCLYVLVGCIGLQLLKIIFDLCDGLRRPLNLIEPLLRLIFRYRDITKKDVGLYLRRFYLTPRTRPSWWPDGWRWFRLFLHMIVRSDDDRDSHDHPWNFVSVILGGSYLEHIYFPGNPAGHRRTRRLAEPGSVLKNRAEHTHQVEIIRPVWSLVLSPEATREWGFWVDDEPDGTNHWVQWDEYLGIKGEARAEEDRMRPDSRHAVPVTQVFTPSEASWFVESGAIVSAPVDGVEPAVGVRTSLNRRSE